MNKRSHITSCLLALCFWGAALHGYAQDITSDFKQINARFYQAQGLSYRFQMDYVSEEDPEGKERIEGEVKIVGALFYQKLGENEVIRTPSALVLLNRESRFIMLYPPQELMPGGPETLRLDTSLKHCDSTRYEVLGADLARYTLFFEEGSVPKQEVSFYPSSYRMKEIVLHQSLEGIMKLRIFFDAPGPPPDPQDPLWKLSTYISQKGNVIVPAQAFAAYELIDFRSQP